MALILNKFRFSERSKKNMKKSHWSNFQITDILPSLCLISSLFIVIYILQLGIMPLVSQDEVRYAEVAREMIVSGNWVVPRLDGIDYFEKPVLGHWMNAVSELVFGGNNFAVRFSSAFCTGLSAVLLFFFLRKFSKEEKIALLAPVIFLTSGLILAIGTFSVLDAQISFFITAAMASFYAAYCSKKITPKFLWLVLCGVFAGLGFLTKGFLVFVVLTISIALFLIWEKKWKNLFTMPWIPLITAIITILPWGINVYYQAPDFWRYFIVVEHYDRFMHAGKYSGALHPEPFWFFIPILFVGALPWAFHLPEIIVGLKDKILFSKSLTRYCVIWAVFPFIFFSASSGKLATYILPCFPPLAVLIAYGLYNALDKCKKEKLFNTTNLIFGYFLITALAAAVIYVIISRFFNIPTLWNLKQLLTGIVAVSFWTALMFFIKKATHPLNKLLLFALAPILAMSLKSYLTPESALTNIAHEKFISEQSKFITKDTTVMAYQDMMGAVCWYLKRDDIYVYGKPGELEHPLKQPEFQSRFINKEKAAAFISEKRNNTGGAAIFLRTKNRKDIPIVSDIDAIKDKTMFSKFNPKQ